MAKTSKSAEVFHHLATFPFQYEINKLGIIRCRVKHGFTYFKSYHEESGVFADILLDVKTRKVLVAEMMLMTFQRQYRPGDLIRYFDGNIHNIEWKNIGFKKPKQSIENKKRFSRPEFIGLWRCDAKASSSNSRAIAKNQIITKEQVLKLLHVCNFSCFYCGDELNPYKWCLDHFQPLSKGGKNEFDNLRASCRECNTMKSDLDHPKFIMKARKIVLTYDKYNNTE